MYNIIKGVLNVGNYKLTDMQHRIKKLYAMGDLTEDQMDALLDMASGGVSPDAERPEMLAMLRNLSERLKALEGRLKALEGGSDEEPGAGEEVAAHPAWEPWDGISNKYQQNEIVTHNGKVWQSTYAGQNVWEPGTAGIDERFWIEYNPEATE